MANEQGLAFDQSVMMAGRGRGVLLTTPDRDFQFMGPEYTSTGRGKAVRSLGDTRPDMCCSPIAKPVKPEYTNVESGLTNEMSDLVRQIGSEIGEAIRDTLLQTGHSSLPSSDRFADDKNISDTKVSNTTIIDASKLNLVLKSEVSSPPYYRGDSTDKCTP